MTFEVARHGYVTCHCSGQCVTHFMDCNVQESNAHEKMRQSRSQSHSQETLTEMRRRRACQFR